MKLEQFSSTDAGKTLVLNTTLQSGSVLRAGAETDIWLTHSFSGSFTGAAVRKKSVKSRSEFPEGINSACKTAKKVFKKKTEKQSKYKFKYIAGDRLNSKMLYRWLIRCILHNLVCNRPITDLL